MFSHVGSESPWILANPVQGPGLEYQSLGMAEPRAWKKKTTFRNKGMRQSHPVDRGQPGCRVRERESPASWT